jgi:hypothetical protein
MVEKIGAICDIKQKLVSNPIPTNPLERHIRVPLERNEPINNFQQNITSSLEKIWNLI